ncbi:hypothetical protein JGS22_003225 [Streptomyces sp. P38-E01]|uniref:LPXTG cell wall anchor domain-containing protein n=1 Tax=Streptomyces tardus TaxID=2780544 RepID=A0A949N3B2_9ACTN|nr:hypothetical protein [Streptomyces tardus]MBU7596674.1 hypothetical protein [Streptomyces tardus]
MAAHHRPLTTAVIAGGVLCALWFVPTANASYESEEPAPPSTVRTAQHAESSEADGSYVTVERADGEAGGADAAPQPAHGPRLADTGGVDTAPYLTGGLAFLAVGAGLVAHSVRHQLRSVA